MICLDIRRHCRDVLYDHMLRVNSSDVLVVPPFECAWLADELGVLRSSSACIIFDAQGDNDATLILKAKPGSKRWQHMELSPGANDNHLEIDFNYTIIFGSHRNTCLKIERNSQECYRVNAPASISGNDFVTCWVNFDNGRFVLGIGTPGNKPFYSWNDSDPIQGIQHVGLGAWDKHVCFRNIGIHPPLAEGWADAYVNGDGDERHGLDSVPTLTRLCQAAVRKGVTVETVCSALTMVDLLQPVLDEVAPTLIGFLARNLENVLKLDPKGFEAMPASLLAEMLGNPCLECSEGQVFGGVCSWAFGFDNHDSDDLVQNIADVEGLLLLIRFPLMSHNELQALREHRLARKSSLYVELLFEAMQARMHQSPETKQNGGVLAVEGKRHIRALGSPTGTARFRRRHAPASKHLMFVSPGDSNGVSTWLGTCYGTQPWVNPVLAGMMQVQASSPTCKQTDPKAVVSGNFCRNNMAGPSKVGATWWLVDLGRQHRLICNYYLLRHDGSTDYPRDWVLQGSTDGGGWVDLREHKKDFSISMPGQSASWPVTSHAASMPYRLFRVLLRAPNASLLGNKSTFHLSLFELYGHLFKIS